MNRGLGHLCTHIYTELSQDNLLRMVGWIRWDCPPDTGFEIQAPVVWGRARYLSVTEAPHNIKSLQVNEAVTICFFETWMPAGGRTRDLRFSKEYIVQAGSFNHCTKAPALCMTRW